MLQATFTPRRLLLYSYYLSLAVWLRIECFQSFYYWGYFEYAYTMLVTIVIPLWANRDNMSLGYRVSWVAFVLQLAVNLNVISTQPEPVRVVYAGIPFMLLSPCLYRHPSKWHDRPEGSDAGVVR